MAEIVPPPAAKAAAPTPAALYVQRMTRVDGCPSCVANYSMPRAVLPAEVGFVASYCCEDCGHHWITSWGDR